MKQRAAIGRCLLVAGRVYFVAVHNNLTLTAGRFTNENIRYLQASRQTVSASMENE